MANFLVTPNRHFKAFRRYFVDLEAFVALAGLVAAAETIVLAVKTSQWTAKTTLAAVQTTHATAEEVLATAKTSLTAEPTVVGAFRINVAP